MSSNTTITPSHLHGESDNKSMKERQSSEKSRQRGTHPDEQKSEPMIHNHLNRHKK